MPRVSTTFALVGAIVTLACRERADVDNHGAPPGAAAKALSQFAEETGVKLPSAAHLIGVRRGERGDVRAKLILNERDWGEFRETMPVSEDELGPGTRGFMDADEDWWDPHATKNLRAGQIQRSSGAYLNVGIDDSDPSAVSVYIFQFGP